MHSSFKAFRATDLGRELEFLITQPHRYTEYVALSRIAVPAVTALVDDLRGRYGGLRDHLARRFCGAMTAEVMRRHGHEVIRARARVPGGFFTYGAVFSPAPLRPEASAARWDAFFAGPGIPFPDRAQPPAQDREAL